MLAANFYRLHCGLVCAICSHGALLLSDGFALANFRDCLIERQCVLELKLFREPPVSDPYYDAISHELIVEVTVSAVLG